MTESDEMINESKHGEVQIETTIQVTESKGHVEGNYFLNINDINFIEQHFDLME